MYCEQKSFLFSNSCLLFAGSHFMLIIRILRIRGPGPAQGILLTIRPPQHFQVRSALSEPEQVLLHTINAVRSAVDKALSDLSVKIKLPQFSSGAASLQWKQDIMDVKKQSISSQLLAVNAATAQVVALWSDPPEEVRAALTTIITSLSEISQDVKIIAALVDDDLQSEVLLDAARNLWSTFYNIMKAAEPGIKKIEAKSVEHVKKLNKFLENKIISLQQKIEELLRENKGLQTRQVNTKEVTAQAELVKQLEGTIKAYDSQVADLVQTIAKLKEENEQLCNEREDIITEKDLLKLEKDEIVEHLNKDNIKLKEDIEKMNEFIKVKEKRAGEELENERAAYQKLLQENARLEQRYENLQNKMIRFKRSNMGHNRTPSNVSLTSVKSDVTEIVRDDISDTHDEDVGYGSIRSKDKESVHLKLDDVKWDDHSFVSKDGSPDEDETRKIEELAAPSTAASNVPEAASNVPEVASNVPEAASNVPLETSQNTPGRFSIVNKVEAKLSKTAKNKKRKDTKKRNKQEKYLENLRSESGEDKKDEKKIEEPAASNVPEAASNVPEAASNVPLGIPKYLAMPHARTELKFLLNQKRMELELLLNQKRLKP